MNMTTTKKTEIACSFKRFLRILKTILICTAVIVAAVLVLALLYKVFEFLFVGAILLIAFACPKWR